MTWILKKMSLATGWSVKSKFMQKGKEAGFFLFLSLMIGCPMKRLQDFLKEENA
jgi:hypothetical protein